MILISVLMPVYNTKSSELQAAIESILEQSYRDFEFIIINDGSTNDAEDVILSYKDERIKYFKNDQNLKLIATLNKGLDLCSGKYIARLDADDYSVPERLERQVRYMESHLNVGLLGTFFEYFPNNEKPVQLESFDDIKLCIRYLPGCLLHSSAMIRKSVLKDNNLYYNTGCVHAEDFKMWSDLSRVCDVDILPEVLTFYRMSDNGICANNKVWQNKMLRVIALENIIRDFECDKQLLYSILVKYIKGLLISKEEFFALKTLLENFLNLLYPKISAPFNDYLLKYITSMLRHFKIDDGENKIIWMNR